MHVFEKKKAVTNCPAGNSLLIIGMTDFFSLPDSQNNSYGIWPSSLYLLTFPV